LVIRGAAGRREGRRGAASLNALLHPEGDEEEDDEPERQSPVRAKCAAAVAGGGDGRDQGTER